MKDLSPRADARRNRDAIVAAARSAFAEQGLSASLDDIAKRARLGSGTLYRHFPTREHLVAAVYTERLADNVAAVEVAQHNADPWSAFASYVRDTCHAQATDKGLAEVLAVGHGDQELQALRTRAYQGFAALIAAAQAAGALRADFTAEDMFILLMANAGISDRAGTVTTATSDRFVALALDGFRTEGATNAPPAPSPRALLNAIKLSEHG